ncbi:uncharacterized protein KY384_003806 [Bacidia gigantensis]|uniref:uncharacterized protein n=1 Tax=Bacidia gigantensis TaxID=2732470 RepID=UPI001D04EDED|nr:uncharacterized protein KY384_003806 [Bacidia gigantensis]KAG8532166.1 hypothetical protein KY384_003806 [Bacidia gigantensis]
MPKRKRQNAEANAGHEDLSGSTAASGREGAKHSELNIYDIPSSAQKTPKRKRGRPPGSTNKPKPTPNSNLTTPSKGKVLFSNRNGYRDSPSATNGSRSALSSKRKDKADTHLNATSREDLDDGDDEDHLVRKIREERRDVSRLSEDASSDDEARSPMLATPSKKTPGKRRKGKSPTPPQDLPPHENYFWQNRPGRAKTSNNTLSSVSLLTHEEYHEHISAYEDPLAEAYENLHQIHSNSFPQWAFELSEDFNICLYGYGSKRRLVTDFAQYMHDHLPTPPKILIVNGYSPTANLRTILATLATLVYDCKSNEIPSNLGSRPQDMLSTLFVELNSHPPDEPICIFINSLDAPPLRRSPIPTLLAQLASHPSIHMLATCDQPNFPLLWDVGLREQYNWVFHDTTTFISYGGVEVPNVVDEVNELLGRSGRSVKGKGGASFVLKSLPESARNLYRILIAEILAATDEDNAVDEDADEDGQARISAGELGGLERKALYQKAVEEFVCSNEMGFGQLLNEFYDHDMLVDRIASDGTKLLGVPWRREECEEILEELVD